MNNHNHMVRELPAGLELLADLATDLRWTWSHAGDALWEALSPLTWEQTENPYVILQNLPRKAAGRTCRRCAFQGEAGTACGGS